MKDSGKQCVTAQLADEHVHDDSGVLGDEINLMDYFLVLWKRKWFIFLVSVLPTLAVGLVIFLGPRSYQIRYIYNVELDEKAFEEKFYSTENIDKLIEQLQASDIKEHAKKITFTGTAEDLREIVSFEVLPSYVLPSYFDAIQPSKAGNMAELEEIQQARGTLLVMHMQAQSKECLRGIALVCRNNFEQVMPLYSVREGLNEKIIDVKEGMAVIEEEKYKLSLQLERKKISLDRLKNSGSEGVSEVPNGIVLQFNNIEENSAYLPLSYQVQATKTQIINLEEQIKASKDSYDYYADLLKLNEKLLSHIEKLMSAYYTLGQFNAFLTNTVADYKKDEQQLQDYLKAYIKRIENKMANAKPLVEKPKVYSVAKGIAKKSVIVFLAAMMLSVFVSFLLEGLKKRKALSS